MCQAMQHIRLREKIFCFALALHIEQKSHVFRGAFFSLITPDQGQIPKPDDAEEVHTFR